MAGSPPRGLKIPAGRRAELVLPTSVIFADLVPVVATFLIKDFAQFRVEGHVGISTPIGIVRLPFAKEGQLEVPKVPEIRVGSPRVANLSLTGATLQLPITLASRNSYELPVSGLEGGVSIGRATVGNISSGDLGRLSPREQRQVTVSLNVDFLRSLEAANAIRQGKGQLSLAAQLHSGGGAVPVSASQLVSFIR